MPTYQVEERPVYPGASEGDPSKLLELGESEIVLDTRHQGNKLLVAVGTPVDVKYECEECGESFDSEHGLKVHQGSQH